jgi:hypothetical protein
MKITLFQTVQAMQIAPDVFEINDTYTRYFVIQAAIDMFSRAKYPDTAEGDGYAEWCRDTKVVSGLGDHGITDQGCTPKFFAAIADGLDSDDDRRTYAVERS